MNSPATQLTELLSQDLTSSTASLNVHQTTPDGVSYRQQVSAINVLSYSTRMTAHGCPRRFLLEKATAANSSDETDNVDFLYGHAVGGGVQNFAVSHDIRSAVWESFLAWKGDLLLELPKSKKSFFHATMAVLQFAGHIGDLLEDWEIATTADGKPAIELAFRLDLGNGYYYMGHIDAVLWHPERRQFMVLELKTTKFNSVDDAQFKNSDQALGYSLVVDILAGLLNADAGNYEVLYLVYKTSMLEWERLPFVKSRQQRANWLFQLRMDCSILDMYRENKHFPTHGENCYNFFRQCEFFGICDMKSHVEELSKHLTIADGSAEVKGVTFYFNINEMKEIV